VIEIHKIYLSTALRLPQDNIIVNDKYMEKEGRDEGCVYRLLSGKMSI